MQIFHVTIISFFLAVSAYFINSSFADWKDPENITRSLAYNLTEQLSEEGIFYPSNDLDDPLLRHRKIVINGAMNETISKEVVRKILFLNAENNKQPIDLYISTNGGWYDSAFTIIDTINSVEAPVNTVCIGGCYSAGAVVMASGTGLRAAHSHALFSIHLFYNLNDDTGAYANLPDRVNKFLKNNTDLPRDWFPLEDDRDYYLSTEEALKFGIVDNIVGAPPRAVVKD